MMNLDRRRFLKFLSAAGVALGARLTGVLPEAQLLAHAQAPPPDAPPPWYAMKPVKQTEIVGAARDAAVKRMLRSADFRNVAASLPDVPTKFAQSLAVESLHEDGSRVLSVGVTLDDHRAITHHRQLGVKSPRTASHAYMSQTVNGKMTGSIIGASRDGLAVQSHVSQGASGMVAATCYGHWCRGCCGWDWNALAECCGSCIFACIPPTPVCILCVGIWCQFCLYWHCNYWCYSCVPYRTPC
jgi:hypothetical protein